MGRSKATWVALIRGIGPATHRKMSMQQLRDACSAAGFEDVRTILATGNLLFSSSRPLRELREQLASVIAAHDLENVVFLRQSDDLEAVLRRRPFPDAASARPNRLLVLFLEREPEPDAIAALRGRAGPERIEAGDRELFIDFAEGVGGSKLTPAVIERHLGQPGTARNWNTVRKLLEASAPGRLEALGIEAP